MCEAFQIFAQRAADKAAKEAAKEERIKTYVETCRELEVSLTDTIRRFAVKFSVPEQDAEVIVKKHW